MPRTAKQIQDGMCISGNHLWVKGQIRCGECKRARDRERYQNDPEHMSKYWRERRQNDPEFREAKKKYNRIYTRKRREENIQFRLADNLRSRLSSAIKTNQKAGSAVSDLGCSILELKQYIEGLWLEGMTWDNWGRGKDKWHIDHVIPLRGKGIDLEDLETFRRVCHYTNLQPL